MEVIVLIVMMVVGYNLQLEVECANDGINKTKNDFQIYKGTATFYRRPYTPSACYGNEEHGYHIAAASKAIWKNRKGCGDYYVVKCVGATNGAPQPCKDSNVVHVKIVDYCRTKGCGTINLSEETFNRIADPNAGRIQIEYLQLKVYGN